MARIAIDASRTTVRQRTGTENYALRLVQHLLQMETPHEFHLYFRDDPPTDLFPGNAKHHVIPFPRAWTHLRFAAALWQSRPDVTWVPAHTLPLFFPGRAIVTVHDLGYKYFPEAHPVAERRYLDWSTRYSAQRARLILADSIATQRDLEHFYGIKPEKVRVVYPGVDIEPVRDATLIRQKYKLPERYLLFLGTLQPRKNIARLVQAFMQWRTQTSHQDVGLVLGGKPGWLYDPAWTADAEHVFLTGYIDDDDIPALYTGAVGLVMPSLFEGFGFPVVEAMRCGIPVVCSNSSSLPELAGEAAILVDPLDVGSIAEGIRQVVEEDTQALVERGNSHVQKFSWDKAAQDVLAAITELVS